MTSQLWQQVQEVLQHALELREEERSAYLDEACAGDVELRREVESLLDTAAEAEDFIEEPVLSLRPEVAEATAGEGREDGTEAVRAVGHYRILEELGRGGMGEVLKAVRSDDEYEKVVAIKLLRRGMDTEEIVRRFRHERQILAHLDHPNIAELFDGGTTGDGLPYFVMEYVEGIPIDRYCDRHRLGIRQRLELFRKVCSAVHFAHQNLVVHRDLKPGNILVTADGEPKLLDFGIAKLLAAERPASGETTLDQLTVAGVEPMTPDYASPEQIRGEPITTASDVYSLGVLLYKLLTGHRPYRLRDDSVARLFRSITDEEPSKPSTVIALSEELQASGGTTVCVDPESVSRDRHTDPRTLKRRLAGDLDCILLKALRKDPKDRYSSMERFSEDIRRHLEGLPVAARKDTFLYQTSKFARRNSLRLAAAAAVFLMIFFGVRAMILASQAERERQIAQSLSTLFQELQGLDPRAAEDPGFAQELRALVAPNVDDVKLADVLNERARLLERRGGFQTAEVLYREAFEMGVRLFGKEQADVVRYLNNLAVVLEAQGEFEEAEALYREALELRIAVHGRESEETARTLNNLGAMLQNNGQLEAAEPYLRESLEIRRKLYPPDAPEVAVAINNHAFFLQAHGDFAEAESGYRQALRIFRENYGLEHPNVGTVLRNLATVLRATGDDENAEKTARQALEILNNSYLKHWRVADAESVLGETLVALGRFDEAEPLLEEGYRVVSDVKGRNARHSKEALARLEYLEEARRRSDPDR